MRKTIITICIVGSALLILDSFNVSTILFTFIIDGSIPGTNVFVSANAMLGFTFLVTAVVIARLIVMPIVRSLTYKPAPVKKRATHRRLSQA